MMYAGIERSCVQHRRRLREWCLKERRLKERRLKTKVALKSRKLHGFEGTVFENVMAYVLWPTQ